MAVLMDLKFDAADKALNWWSVFADAPSTLALPRFVVDGSASYVEIDFAARNAILNDTVAAFSVKEGPISKFQGSVMDQNLNFNAGQAVTCYDPDTAKRGIFYKQGASGTGSWLQDSWRISDKCWPDQNHPEKLLELLLCSWIRYPVPHPGAGNYFGWDFGSAFQGDWRNLKITFDMRCIDLYLGSRAKICQHVQGDIPRLTWRLPKSVSFTVQPSNNSILIVNGVSFRFVVSGVSGTDVLIGTTVADTVANLAAKLSTSASPAVLLATYSAVANVLNITTKPYIAAYRDTPFTLASGAPPAPTTNAQIKQSYATPNFVFTKQLISDQLGFGVGSWGNKNRVSHVTDSGRRDVVLNLSGGDADWECLGSVDRPLTFYDYVVAPVAELLERVVGNSYMMVVHPKEQADANTFVPVGGGLSENERVSGKLLIYGIKVEN